jgi:hypothetical protein
MKKLSVVIVSLALSVNSFAGGKDDWVAPFIVGGIVGAVVVNNMKQQERPVNIIRVEPGFDCRRGVDYPHPACYNRRELREAQPVASYGAAPVYFNSFPSGTPPRGYHFEQVYFDNCNCLKWTLAQD